MQAKTNPTSELKCGYVRPTRVLELLKGRAAQNRDIRNDIRGETSIMEDVLAELTVAATAFNMAACNVPAEKRVRTQLPEYVTRSGQTPGKAYPVWAQVGHALDQDTAPKAVQICIGMHNKRVARKKISGIRIGILAGPDAKTRKLAYQYLNAAGTPCTQVMETTTRNPYTDAMEIIRKTLVDTVSRDVRLKAAKNFDRAMAIFAPVQAPAPSARRKAKTARLTAR